MKSIGVGFHQGTSIPCSDTVFINIELLESLNCTLPYSLVLQKRHGIRIRVPCIKVTHHGDGRSIWRPYAEGISILQTAAATLGMRTKIFIRFKVCTLVE